MDQIFAQSFFFFLAICAFISIPHASAARYVPVTISLNGKVIFEGNASDNGERDADEVWEALKESRLRPTRAFGELGLDVSGDHLQLNAVDSDETNNENHEAHWFEIDVAYGGFARTRNLTLERVKPDAAGRIWRITSGDVDGLFDWRFVRRLEIPELKKPSYLKIKDKVK